jgi:hypothetical protein
MECCSASTIEVKVFRVRAQLSLHCLVRFLACFETLTISSIRSSNGHINKVRVSVPLYSMCAEIGTKLRAMIHYRWIVTIIITKSCFRRDGRGRSSCTPYCSSPPS